MSDQSVAAAAGPHRASRRPFVSWLWAVAILCVTAGLLLIPLDNSYRALWYGETMDACHVPLFALLTWLLGRLSPPKWRWWVIIGATSVACGAEVVQPFFGRSASWRDLAYGIIGIALGVVWLTRGMSLLPRILVTVLLIAWPAARTGPVLIDAFQAWREFPLIADFQGPFPKRRWLLMGVTMTPHSTGAQLTFAPSRQGSGAILLPVVRDWTGYQALEVEFAFEGEPLTLLISVRDGKKLPPKLPRFDLWRQYSAGSHHVRIELDELARGGQFPPIDLKHVQSFHLVAVDKQLRTIDVQRIELTEKRSATIQP